MVCNFFPGWCLGKRMSFWVGISEFLQGDSLGVSSLRPWCHGQADGYANDGYFAMNTT